MGNFGEFFSQWLQQNGNGMGSQADQGSAAGFLNQFNQMNSDAQLQNNSQGFQKNMAQFNQGQSDAAHDKQFAMSQGMQSYHDQFQPPMDFGSMMAMAKSMTPQRPFRDDQPIGFGVRYIQQLLGG